MDHDGPVLVAPRGGGQDGQVQSKPAAEVDLASHVDADQGSARQPAAGEAVPCLVTR
ncbi:hypothetical protein GZL_02206 [Streptomyces sp. 769]|nr:hypothetical protein GZL_02206 [Streptomyces sp. 769]